MPGHFFVYFPTLPPLNVTPSFPNLSRVFLLSFRGPFPTLFSSIPRCALLPLYLSALSQLPSVRRLSVLPFLSFLPFPFLLSISPLHNSQAPHFLLISNSSYFLSLSYSLFLFSSLFLILLLTLSFFSQSSPSLLIPYPFSHFILPSPVLPSLSSFLILLLKLYFSSQSSPLSPHSLFFFSLYTSLPSPTLSRIIPYPSSPFILLFPVLFSLA